MKTATIRSKFNVDWVCVLLYFRSGLMTAANFKFVLLKLYTESCLMYRMQVCWRPHLAGTRQYCYFIVTRVQIWRLLLSWGLAENNAKHKTQNKLFKHITSLGTSSLGQRKMGNLKIAQIETHCFKIKQGIHSFSISLIIEFVHFSSELCPPFCHYDCDCWNTLRYKPWWENDANPFHHSSMFPVYKLRWVFPVDDKRISWIITCWLCSQHFFFK